jgi:hypothetical protein
MSAQTENNPQQVTTSGEPKCDIFKNLMIYVEVYNSNLDQSEHFKDILQANGAKVINF